MLRPETGCVEVTRPVQGFLNSAPLDADREMDGRDRSINATQTHPAFIVTIIRLRVGGY